MRLLLDLIKATAGSASLLGLDTRDESLAIRRRIGFLPADFALYPKLTGGRRRDRKAEPPRGCLRGWAAPTTARSPGGSGARSAARGLRPARDRRRSAARSTTAGEEEERVLALVLAHPVKRSRLVVAKAAAVAVSALIIAFGTWLGLIIGVAVAGGGIGLGDLGALSLHLAFFGVATGMVALALGAGTGRRALAPEARPRSRSSGS
jgi:ABC-2 family transporter protein